MKLPKSDAEKPCWECDYFKSQGASFCHRCGVDFRIRRNEQIASQQAGGADSVCNCHFALNFRPRSGKCSTCGKPHRLTNGRSDKCDCAIFVHGSGENCFNCGKLPAA